MRAEFVKEVVGVAGVFGAQVGPDLRHAVRLVANTKPAMLLDHPLYAEAQAAGLLLRGADGAPAVSQWWDGLASYIDFTAPGALAWWQAQASAALLAPACGATTMSTRS